MILLRGFFSTTLPSTDWPAVLGRTLPPSHCRISFPPPFPLFVLGELKVARLSPRSRIAPRTCRRALGHPCAPWRATAACCACCMSKTVRRATSMRSCTVLIVASRRALRYGGREGEEGCEHGGVAAAAAGRSQRDVECDSGCRRVGLRAALSRIGALAVGLRFNSAVTRFQKSTLYLRTKACVCRHAICFSQFRRQF